MRTTHSRVNFTSLAWLERNRYKYLLLATITLLALLLRLYKLGEWSFWIDEIFTINRFQAQYSSIERTLHNIPPHKNWVPVSLLFIAGLTNIFGISEWSVRLGPALIGVLTIPILFFPFKRLFNTRTALIWALLLAVSPWHLYWSQNGRFYTSLMLFHTLALLAIHFGLEQNRTRYLVLGHVFFYLAMSERMIALLLVPAIATYLISLVVFRFDKPLGFNRKNILILLIPVIVGVAMVGSGLLLRGSSSFLDDYGFFLSNPIDSLVRILILILFSVGLPVVILTLSTGTWLVRERSRSGLLFTVCALVPVLILIIISPWVFVVERYALITLPAWLMITSVALDQLVNWLPSRGRWLAATAVALLLADAAGAHLMYYQLNNGNRPDWRGAFAYVRRQKAPEDLIVSTEPEIGSYYLGVDESIIELADTHPTELQNENRTVWFVIDSESVWFSPIETIDWMEANADLLFVWYLRTREQTDMKVYRYDPSIREK